MLNTWFLLRKVGLALTGTIILVVAVGTIHIGSASADPFVHSYSLNDLLTPPLPYGPIKEIPRDRFAAEEFGFPVDGRNNLPFVVDFVGGQDRYYAAFLQYDLVFPGQTNFQNSDGKALSFTLVELDRLGNVLRSWTHSEDEEYGPLDRQSLYVNFESGEMLVGLQTKRDGQWFADVYEVGEFSLERIVTLEGGQPTVAHLNAKFGNYRGISSAGEFLFEQSNGVTARANRSGVIGGATYSGTGGVMMEDGRHFVGGSAYHADGSLAGVLDAAPAASVVAARFFSDDGYVAFIEGSSASGIYTWPAVFPSQPGISYLDPGCRHRSSAIGGDGSLCSALYEDLTNYGPEAFGLQGVYYDCYPSQEYDWNDGFYGGAFSVEPELINFTGDGCFIPMEKLDNGDTLILAFALDGSPIRGQVLVQPVIEPNCGNTIVEADVGEQCDDGNTEELDGCASDCTFQGCGDGTLDTGEQCDDGNRTNGDGCSLVCLNEESVDVAVGAGGTADSDSEADGATPEDPVETKVTVPAGGQVTIVETDDDSVPSGYSGIGKKVEISVTPGGTVSEPLEITFTADPSIIPAGETPSTVQVFRNGVRVLPCTGAPSAVPDPCISSIQPVGGDYALTVLTSAASTWELGFACGDGNLNPSLGEECDDGNTVSGDGCSAGCGLEALQDKDQVKCMATVAKSVEKIIKAQAKLNAKCVKDASKEKVPDATACLLADEKAKVFKAREKFVTNVTKRCEGAAIPDFGYSGQDGISAAAIWRGFLADLVADPSTAVVLASANKAAAKCQQAVLKAADKHAFTVIKEFAKCVKSGLKIKPDVPPAIQSRDAIASCILADPKGTIAKSTLKFGVGRAKKCEAIDLSAVFAGDCGPETGAAFDQCVVTRANCTACRYAKVAYRLGVDCDALDDDTNNSSCPE